MSTPGPASASGGEPTLTPSLAEVLAADSERASEPIVVRSEFASVAVWLRDPGGRPRLHLHDLRTRQSVELDALELETLAWAMHSDLAPLLDPSATRWTGEELLDA